MKNKNLAKNLIIALTLSLTAILIVGRKDLIEALKKLPKIPYYIWILGMALIVLKWIVESIVFYMLIRDKGYKPRFSTILKFTIASYLFHYITPFQSGGQIFQIYYLTLMEIPAGISGGIIIMKSLIFQVSVILLILFSLPAVKHLKNLTIEEFIGAVILLALMLIILYILASSRRVWRSPVVKSLRKIIHTRYKNLYKTIAKELLLFRKMWHNTRHSTILISILLTLIQIILFISPLVVIIYHFVPSTDILTTLKLAIIGDLIGGIMPTPGGSGGVETSLIIISTASGIETSVSILAVSIWRIITYYMPILAGMVALALLGIDNPEDFIGKKRYNQREYQKEGTI